MIADSLARWAAMHPTRAWSPCWPAHSSMAQRADLLGMAHTWDDLLHQALELLDRGHLEEASRAAERALAMAEQACDPPHPDVAELTFLAMGVAMLQGRLDGRE